MPAIASTLLSRWSVCLNHGVREPLRLFLGTGVFIRCDLPSVLLRRLTWFTIFQCYAYVNFSNGSAFPPVNSALIRCTGADYNLIDVGIFRLFLSRTDIDILCYEGVNIYLASHLLVFGLKPSIFHNNFALFDWIIACTVAQRNACLIKLSYMWTIGSVLCSRLREY